MRPLLRTLALAALVVVVSGGCNEQDSRETSAPSTRTGAGTPATPTPADPALITGTGTVRYLEFEGGFWGIVADDSARYDPGTIDERFRTDGMRVRFDVRKNEGQMSTRQWGTLVTVVRLDPL